MMDGYSLNGTPDGLVNFPDITHTLIHFICRTFNHNRVFCGIGPLKDTFSITVLNQCQNAGSHSEVIYQYSTILIATDDEFGDYFFWLDNLQRQGFLWQLIGQHRSSRVLERSQWVSLRRRGRSLITDWQRGPGPLVKPDCGIETANLTTIR